VRIPSPLLAFLLLLPACGDEDGGSSDGTAEGEGEGPVSFSVGRYCLEMAGAACHLAMKCNNQYLFYDRHLDQAECVEALSAECEAEAVPLGLSQGAGAVRFDNTAFRACLDEIGEGTCTEGAHAWGLTSCYTALGGARVCDPWFFGRALSEHCRIVLVGVVDEGEPCYWDRECGAERYCYRRGASSCPGECRRHLERSDDCLNNEAACGSGLVCGGSARTIKRCMPEALQGEECVTRGTQLPERKKPTCAAPFACLPSGQAGDLYGRCAPLVPRGGQCGDRRAKCEPDSFCLQKSTLSVEGTCEAFFPEDRDCDDSLGTPKPCGFGMTCFGPGTDVGVPGRAGSEGRCAPYPRCTDEGCQPCIRNDSNCVDAYCTAGAPSFEGICSPLRDIGQECSLQQQCRSRFCGWNEEHRAKVCEEPLDPWEGVCLRPESERVQ